MNEARLEKKLIKDQNFENQRRKFFIRVGLQVREALQMHKNIGLWEKREGKRDWGNVSEHCLVEVARAQVFAEKLNLPKDVANDLIIAAALHDFFKKNEKEIVTKKGISWENFEELSQESTNRMREAGFNERVIFLANSVGHGSLVDSQKIIKNPSLNQDDIAYLILHYIDDYTIGSEWAVAAETMAGGTKINDLDRRIEKNENNFRYAELNEYGKTIFDGKTTYEANREIDWKIEAKLAALLNEKNHSEINPKDLPVFIDEEIKKEIMQEA